MRNERHKHSVGNYEVGYKRPPREHQFKKGAPSPYPRGRPRGSLRLDLTKALMEPITIKLRGRKRNVPFLEAWVQVMKEKALKGDIKAGQTLIMLAHQMKMIKTIDESIDDAEFEVITLNVDMPPGVRERMEAAKKGRTGDG